MTSCPSTSTASAEPVPLFLPLLRDRLDPVAELGALRAIRPVARLDVPDDMPAVWLVTGHEEVRTSSVTPRRSATTSPDWRGPAWRTSRRRIPEDWASPTRPTTPAFDVS